MRGCDARRAQREQRLEDGFATARPVYRLRSRETGAYRVSNFQHRNHATFFPDAPRSEQHCRAGALCCWRFGQKRDVTVDVVATEWKPELSTTRSTAKAAGRQDKLSNLVAETNRALPLSQPTTRAQTNEISTHGCDWTKCGNRSSSQYTITATADY